MLRRRPADLGLQPDGDDAEAEDGPPARDVPAREALRSLVFLALTAAFSLAMLANTAIRVHFVPYLLDQGVDEGLAAAGAGFIGAAQVLGRLCFAPVAERLSLHLLTALSFALQLLALLFLLMLRGDWSIWLFVLSFGAAVGAATLLRPAILAQRFGPAQFGRISSVMVVFLTLAGVIAPVGASAIHDLFGGYRPVLWAIAAITLLALLALAPLRGSSTTAAGR